MGGESGQAQTQITLEHVYWLGGSPCAGKSTVADIIAQEHDWQIYHIDRYVESYIQRAQSHIHPQLTYYKQIGLGQFLALPPDEQFERVQGLCVEYLGFVLADIAEFPDDTPILVEGSNLRLQDLISYLPNVHHAFCMAPTEEFLFRAYPKRGTWVQDVLRHYYPENQRIDVFEKWMTRDAMHAEWASQQARDHNIPLIQVDGTQTIRHNAAQVERHFELPALIDVD